MPFRQSGGGDRRMAAPRALRGLFKRAPGTSGKAMPTRDDSVARRNLRFWSSAARLNIPRRILCRRHCAGKISLLLCNLAYSNRNETPLRVLLFL